jgi:hypothetical protein
MVDVPWEANRILRVLGARTGQQALPMQSNCTGWPPLLQGTENTSDCKLELIQTSLRGIGTSVPIPCPRAFLAYILHQMFDSML